MAQENKVQAKILWYARSIMYVVRVDSTRAGVADIIGCYKGRFVSLEIKDPDEPSKTHNELQELNAMSVRSHGGIAKTISSIKELLEILGEIDADTAPTPS